MCRSAQIGGRTLFVVPLESRGVVLPLVAKEFPKFLDAKACRRRDGPNNSGRFRGGNAREVCGRVRAILAESSRASSRQPLPR